MAALEDVSTLSDRFVHEVDSFVLTDVPPDVVRRAKFVTTGLADPSKPQRARVKINFKAS